MPDDNDSHYGHLETFPNSNFFYAGNDADETGSPSFAIAEPHAHCHDRQMILPGSDTEFGDSAPARTLVGPHVDLAAPESPANGEASFSTLSGLHFITPQGSIIESDDFATDLLLDCPPVDPLLNRVPDHRPRDMQDVLAWPEAATPSRREDSEHGPSFSPTILHIPTVLIEYYFQNVCRECSTFDSLYNPFRSTIANMQSSSPSIHHVIQSLAAAKLADDMPRMRIAGIEAQGEALRHLKHDIMTTNGLHNVSEDVLCTILLLGMTTSWHVREDLGVEYFMLARSVIIAKSQALRSTIDQNLTFYQNALKYWSMIVSLVSDRTGAFDGHDEELPNGAIPLRAPSLHQMGKIMPHPWTGISPTPMHLFGRVLQLVRNTRRGSSTMNSSRYSMSGFASVLRAISTAQRLEAECWSLIIPAVTEIEDTNDTNTPPIHHVLTAKSYLLSALLHIYMVFPDVLEARIKLESASAHTTPISEVDFHNADTAHIVTPTSVWPRRSAEDPDLLWLQDIGVRVVECLAAIDVKSGTRVVHPPLLLSVASALTFVEFGQGASGNWKAKPAGVAFETERSDTAEGVRHPDARDANRRVRQCRDFIINRLETMHALMRFHAIENILKVVKEVWKRADTGSRDTFWMDIMHELQCETIFG